VPVSQSGYCWGARHLKVSARCLTFGLAPVATPCRDCRDTLSRRDWAFKSIYMYINYDLVVYSQFIYIIVQIGCYPNISE